MIFDSLENFRNYETVHAQFPAIGRYLGTADLRTLAVGRYDITRQGSYMLVQEYETKDAGDCFIECHREFIDLQMVVSGMEKIGVCLKKHCSEQSYDNAKDLQILDGSIDFITMQANEFVLLFPQDGHMPKVKAGSSAAKVRKVVIKIPV